VLGYDNRCDIFILGLARTSCKPPIVPAPRQQSGSSGDTPRVRFEDCWAKTTADAKPGMSVRSHCENVGSVAEALLHRLPDTVRNQLQVDSAPVLAAVHDIGKVTPGFQLKCPTWGNQHKLPALPYETDHAKVSQFTLESTLGSSILRPWAAIVGAHHGGIQCRPKSAEGLHHRAACYTDHLTTPTSHDR
jgi:CRISPR-associated endonuclease Cas3-HD